MTTAVTKHATDRAAAVRQYRFYVNLVASLRRDEHTKGLDLSTEISNALASAEELNRHYNLRNTK